MTENYSILFIGLTGSEESLVSAHFSRSGKEVFAAGDLAEARERLRSRKVDLTYLRSAADGGAIRQLQELTGIFPSVPVVFVCDRMPESLVLEAWRAGAADILFLPLTGQALDDSLQRSARRMSSREIQANPPSAARFFYLDEGGRECWATVKPPRFTIGRGSANNLVLGQMGVSRSHAEVLVQDGEYGLHDLGSKLGTYLNGVRVEQARLKDGDRVQLGGPMG